MSNDLLEQLNRLLKKREAGQADFEARVRDSKRALARSQKMLDKLNETIARAIAEDRRHH
jgi:hypothetical protein